MDMWRIARRSSFNESEEEFAALVTALGIDVPVGTTREQFRDIHRRRFCGDDGWPTAFKVLGPSRIVEGIEVRSVSGTIEGRTTGNRRRCSATSTNCPGWFIEVVWETGQTLWPCSEGWHHDGDSGTVRLIAGGEISARFVTPKPLGTQPAPRSEWPSRKDLHSMRGWRAVR